MMRAILVCWALLGLSSSAAAAEWIQITLEGAIVQPGGAPIEFELGARQRGESGEARQVVLRPHFGPHTKADDIVRLLHERFERESFDVFVSSPQDGGTRCHLFVENAIFVRLRLGHGLRASVTVCEGAPTAVRVLAPQTKLGKAELYLGLSAEHPHSENRRREELSVGLEAHMHAAMISESITRECLSREWIAERPRPDAWRVAKLGDGSRLIGFNIELRTDADWRLELEFGS